MKKITVCVVAALALITVFCAAQAEAARKNVLRVNSGAAIQSMGVVIDASYDPRLDELAPGYKIVSVAIANQSVNIVEFDLEGDLWQVKLAGSKKLHKAVHNLRTTDPKAWQTLSPKVRELTAYPLVLPIGGSIVVDLFLPDTLDLDLLTEVSMGLKKLGGRIDIVVRD